MHKTSLTSGEVARVAANENTSTQFKWGWITEYVNNFYSNIPLNQEADHRIHAGSQKSHGINC